MKEKVSERRRDRKWQGGRGQQKKRKSVRRWGEAKRKR